MVKKPTHLPYTCYFSFGVFDPVDLPTFKRGFNAWVNHLNASRGYVPFYEVPDTGGTLWAFNTNDCANWTRNAFTVAGNRDYLYTEINIGHRDAEALRLLTGVQQDPKTLAVVRVINAYQFFRDTFETDRAETYNDILYGKERHPDDDTLFQLIPRTDQIAPPKEPVKQFWPGNKPWRDGKLYPNGFEYISFEENERYQKELKAYQESVKAVRADAVPVPLQNNKGNKKFPETGLEFERRWGAEIKADDIKRFLIDPRFGGIAKGSENDPKAGSFVRLNDAAIRIVKTQFGWSARTFDVFENTGDRDHFARLEQVALGNAKADGGEILASLPNGAQTGMLVNADDKVVTIANSKLAQIRNQKIDKFTDVRTFGSCLICHGPNGGFIAFQEAVNESIKKGLQGKEIDNELARQVRDFFTRWEDDVKGLQAPYLRFIAETTATKDDPKGWTPATLINELKRFRDKYDLPVTLETAARELGVTKRDLKTFLLNLSPDEKGRIRESVRNRINQLATEQEIPRRAWEVDVVKEVGILLNAAKIQEEPIKRIISEQLLDTAIKDFHSKYGGKR
jgi:hypothetical protein